jgi:virulence-associated protein VapD
MADLGLAHRQIAPVEAHHLSAAQGRINLMALKKTAIAGTLTVQNMLPTLIWRRKRVKNSCKSKRPMTRIIKQGGTARLPNHPDLKR